MNHEQIFYDFTSTISKIVATQRSIFYSRISEIKELKRIAEILDSNKEKNDWFSTQNIGFTTADDGEWIYADNITLTVEDQRRAILKYHNKFYLWLLSEAHERFKDYVEDLYALLGYKKKLWPEKEFLNAKITREEAYKNGLEYFRIVARNKRDRPSSILNEFRKTNRDFEKTERINKLGVNLRLVMNLIEKIRHAAVHSSGKIDNKDEFIKDILNKSMLSRNGKPEIKDIFFIEKFFGSGEDKNTIFLIEQKNPEVKFSSLINNFDGLIRLLLSYGHLIHIKIAQQQF